MTSRSFYRLVVKLYAITYGALFVLCLFEIVSGYDAVWMIEHWPMYVWTPLWIMAIALMIGGALLWLGMIRECLCSPRLSNMAKLLWIILLLCLNYLGSLIFYFCVYRKQPAED